MLKNKVLSLLVTSARLRPLKPLVSFFYRYMNHFLPIDRLCEGEHWEAFYHPQPAYPLHILILPKRLMPALVEATHEDPNLYADLFRVVQKLISGLKLEDRGYRLVTNGGPNQSIPIWHWHLICEESGKGSENPGVAYD